MQATKWLKVQLLISGSEMESLLRALGHFDIYIAGAVTSKGAGLISHAQFLKTYGRYVEALETGRLPVDADYPQIFGAVFTKDPQSMFAVPVGTDRQLWRVARPVIQLQPHSLDYSSHDGKFRPMVFGSESVLWGLQILPTPSFFRIQRPKKPLMSTEAPFFPIRSYLKAYSVGSVLTLSLPLF